MKTLKFVFTTEEAFEGFVENILNELKEDLKDYPELGSCEETDTEIILTVNQLEPNQ